jgi:DNA-binding beta-propeller fold protein YncE
MASQNAKRDGNFVPTLIGVSSSDGTSPTLVYVDPVTHRLYVDLAGGGGGLTVITFTGAVNGSNLSFTTTSQPTYVVSDGIWYRATDANSNVQWSYSGGTVTLSIAPPNTDIYGF